MGDRTTAPFQLSAARGQPAPSLLERGVEGTCGLGADGGRERVIQPVWARWPARVRSMGMCSQTPPSGGPWTDSKALPRPGGSPDISDICSARDLRATGCPACAHRRGEGGGQSGTGGEIPCTCSSPRWHEVSGVQGVRHVQRVHGRQGVQDDFSILGVAWCHSGCCKCKGLWRQADDMRGAALVDDQSSLAS